MVITFDTARPCFIGFKYIVEVLNSTLNTIINNIKRQIRVIFMELLQKFNVQIVNMHKKYAITYYRIYKAVLSRFPGNFFKLASYFLSLFKLRLARG